MLKFLGINVNQFGEEDEPEVEVDVDVGSFIDEQGNLDVEGLVGSYVPEYTDDETEEIEELEEIEEEPEPEIEAEPESEKRTSDQAFAEMRRQIEAQEPLAKWVQDLAIQQGFTKPEDMIQEFEAQKLAKEAEEKGVPVDVYQRLHELEKENEQQREQATAERFHNEVNLVKEKYNLEETHLKDIFDYMAKNNYHPGVLPFEDVYVLANKDNLIKEAEERGRQEYLKNRKQKQTQATPNISTSSEDTNDQSLDYSKEGIFNTMKEMGIDID